MRRSQLFIVNVNVNLDAYKVKSSPKSTASKDAVPASALYKQLKDHVLQKIADGNWSVGFKLPSENDFVVQFGMSRMTVSRALRELSTQGVINRVAGVGSFVAEEKHDLTLLQIANLANEVRQRGHTYLCKVVVTEKVPATVELSALLDVPSGASLFHVVCVHFEEGVPVQLEDRFVNPLVVPKFFDEDFTAVQPSQVLLQNAPLDQLEHVVDAVVPSHDQAALLKIETRQPCLMLTRRTWSGGVPVTIVRFLHPANRYRLSSRIRVNERSAAG